MNVGEDGITRDFDRSLTPDGMENVARVARLLVAMQVKPETILSSPLVRANQTAEIVAEVLGVGGKLEVDDTFTCGMDPSRAVAALNRRRAGDVMVVGHAPDMGEFAAYLISAAGDVSIFLRTSGVCCIQFEGKISKGTGVLSWLIPPSLAEIT